MWHSRNLQSLTYMWFRGPFIEFQTPRVLYYKTPYLSGFVCAELVCTEICPSVLYLRSSHVFPCACMHASQRPYPSLFPTVPKLHTPHFIHRRGALSIYPPRPRPVPKPTSSRRAPIHTPLPPVSTPRKQNPRPAPRNQRLRSLPPSTSSSSHYVHSY